MMTEYCCSDCHEADGACTYCLLVDHKQNSKKELAIHFGYVALHVIQMILIIGLVK